MTDETLRVRPMDAEAAEAVLSWRYVSPYDIYNLVLEGDERARAQAFFLDAFNGYHRIDGAKGELLAFCCFGADAQVPGGDYTSPALDVGLGLRPDLTGRGLGATFARAALAFGAERYRPVTWRVTIAAFNLRAQRVWHGLGFQRYSAFEANHGGRFVILFRAAGD